MNPRSIVAAIAALLTLTFCNCAVTSVAVSEAYYFISSSAEHQSPPVKRARLVMGPTEKVRGKVYHWWEMHLEKPDGNVIGVRVLSDRVPLTSEKPAGSVARYIYSPTPGQSFEYVDALTGRAVLPEIECFLRDYFPHSSSDAKYVGGFATTGRLMGHVLVRYLGRFDFTRPDFGNPTVLRLRSDLRIGGQIDGRDDRDESVPIEERQHTPYTREEYMELIAAGVNYFHPGPEAVDWLKNLPVFWNARGIHPDDFYRSNFCPGSMFIDEPATRFGWDKPMTTEFAGPAIIANAIRMRVEEAQLPKHRVFDCVNSFNTGTMEALYNKYPSWETQQFTAWYQLEGGAPGLIFEGRYVKRGYGWNPEMLLGNGLEELNDKQQFDYFHAFLRGAARRWNGYWGTSIYPEGDRSMMVPALIRAYDQGAKCLWFWCDRNLPYRWRLEVMKQLNEHIVRNPARKCASASTAIVLPAGYMLATDTIWGMPREQVNAFCVSYGDIAAAALFEGILLSRNGIEYDYVNDYEGLNNAGYKQLIYVREDGTLEWVPKKSKKNAPKGLWLQTHRQEKEQVRPEPPAQYQIQRARNIRIDGDLEDWVPDGWIEMRGQPYHFGDNYELELSLLVPQDLTKDSDQKCLGFTWEQINEDYRQKYLLEGYGEDQVVVTSVIPGGAAEMAGLREGDIILKFGEKKIRWAFEVWGMVDWCKRHPGSQINLLVQRNGIDHLGGTNDLSARVAFAVDDENLYVGVDVVDDVHYQAAYGSDFWMQDSVQIGLDPMMSSSDSYDDNCHEFGLVLRDGETIVWRWAGRRGQPVNAIKSAVAAAMRKGSHTFYEAAIPLQELQPLTPDMWKRVRMSVVVNDSDGTTSRKARLELVPGAMTRGKHVERFPVFEFEPSGNLSKLSAAIFWEKRCLKAGGAAELLISACSPATRQAVVRCRLSSLDDPDTKPIVAKTTLKIGKTVAHHRLLVKTLSPPGRYRLDVEVTAPDGNVAARDSLPIYVYQ